MNKIISIYMKYHNVILALMVASLVVNSITSSMYMDKIFGKLEKNDSIISKQTNESYNNLNKRFDSISNAIGSINFNPNIIVKENKTEVKKDTSMAILIQKMNEISQYINKQESQKKTILVKKAN